jgi:hypothetical protein
MFSSKMDIAAFLWKDSRPMRDRRFHQIPALFMFVRADADTARDRRGRSGWRRGSGDR